jgi:hypothetical protein
LAISSAVNGPVGGTDVDEVATAVDEVAVSADVDAPLPVSSSPQPVAASVIINATASTTALRLDRDGR